jgi:hypothetical protein
MSDNLLEKLPVHKRVTTMSPAVFSRRPPAPVRRLTRFPS